MGKKTKGPKQVSHNQLKSPMSLIHYLGTVNFNNEYIVMDFSLYEIVIYFSSSSIDNKIQRFINKIKICKSKFKLTESVF